MKKKIFLIISCLIVIVGMIFVAEFWQEKRVSHRYSQITSKQVNDTIIYLAFDSKKEILKNIVVLSNIIAWETNNETEPCLLKFPEGSNVLEAHDDYAIVQTPQGAFVGVIIDRFTLESEEILMLESNIQEVIAKHRRVVFPLIPDMKIPSRRTIVRLQLRK